MALGIKTKKGLEQGDIIQANAGVVVFEKQDNQAVQYDTAIIGDRIGYATGQTVIIGSSSYIELVLINRVLESQSPDFSTPKFYILSGAPVSFKANPDYNYLTTTVASGTNFWGSLGNILTSVLNIFSGNKTTGIGPTAEDSSTVDNNSAVTTPKEPQESWLKKNVLLVGSGVVLAVTVVIIVVVGKKKDK